ncbi:MAG: MAE_28990/MAE_18760 family HEPN-like nuclease [Nostoc sp. DedSLP01]
MELEALVVRRNDIAHGQKMIIKDIQEYLKYEKAAVEVMHELAVSVVECLDKKLYLNSP